VALLNRLDLRTFGRRGRRRRAPDARPGERDAAGPQRGGRRHARRANNIGGASGASRSPLEHDTYSLGLSLELPLDRVRERGALRAARIELDRARRGLSLKEDSVILEVRDAMRNLRSPRAA